MLLLKFKTILPFILTSFWRNFVNIVAWSMTTLHDPAGIQANR